VSAEAAVAVEAELSAALRTVDVLKEKVRAMGDGSQSVIQKQLEAARRRGVESRQRREIVELRAAELSLYSERLEREVAQRTLAMRRILNNVTFGFLVVDSALLVQPESTDSCATLLGAATLEGQALPGLLRLSERDESAFRLCMDQVFEDILPEEVSLAQARTDFPIGDRTIRVEGRAVRDVGGRIEGILFTVSDITELLAALREGAQNRMLVGILRNKASFRNFLEDTRMLLAQARGALDSGDDATLRRSVHTIKGNSASYDLCEIVSLVHGIEEVGIDAGGLAAIRARFGGFLREHEALLGLCFEATPDDAFEVSLAQVSSLRQIATRLGSNELSAWAAQVTERPADTLLGPIGNFTERLASRLGKRACMVVAGGESLVDDATMRPVMQTLVHLVRNAVDHGIEAPHLRGEKPPVGELRLSVAKTPLMYEITLSDDGMGIDVERVTRSAVGRGLVTPAQADRMREAERQQLIFLEGVSSAEETNETSGRGVGMSAVRAVVNASGGRLRVCSERGRGTTFTIEVPRAPVARPSAQAG
jgi:two-component system, chemotaxis family, sensor kinase CheA